MSKTPPLTPTKQIKKKIVPIPFSIENNMNNNIINNINNLNNNLNVNAMNGVHMINPHRTTTADGAVSGGVTDPTVAGPGPASAPAPAPASAPAPTPPATTTTNGQTVAATTTPQPSYNGGFFFVNPADLNHLISSTTPPPLKAGPSPPVTPDPKPAPKFNFFQRLKKVVRTIPLLSASYFFTSLIFPHHPAWWIFYGSFVVLVVFLRFFFIGNTGVTYFLTVIFGLLIIASIFSIFGLVLPNLSSNISSRLFGQDAMIKSFLEAHGKKKNFFVLVGPSGVGKSFFADIIAEEFKWLNLRNIYSLRLSDLSQKYITMFVQDIDQLFNKKNRNSIAYFVENECKNPGCVVVLDDFHVFAGFHSRESNELIRRLDKYAMEHKEVIFMVVVETTSIMNPLDTNLNPTDRETNLNLEMKLNKYLENIPVDSPMDRSMMAEIDDIIKQKVSSLQFSKNYTLLPFSPLSLKMQNWELVLPTATKKKLTDGATKICQVLRLNHNFIDFSDSVVSEVVSLSFDDQIGGGMRTINTYWLPLLFETMKYKCPGSCSLFFTLLIEREGGEWVCQCKVVFSKQILEGLILRVMHWASENDGIVQGIIKVLLALFS